MESKPSYYTLLRNGEVRFQQTKPKGKVFVMETIEHLEDQHTQHTLLRHDACGLPQHPAQVMDAWCGFDRGPKLTGHIRRMLS
jgi:hypothetical protein